MKSSPLKYLQDNYLKPDYLKFANPGNLHRPTQLCPVTTSLFQNEPVTLTLLPLPAMMHIYGSLSNQLNPAIKSIEQFRNIYMVPIRPRFVHILY